MKKMLLLLLLCAGSRAKSQEAENIFIITTDGFRWQEVFNGADSTLLNDTRYVEDTALMKQLYWDSSASERRRRLLPFFWNVIARKGQLYGNRTYDNQVNVRNPYKISYPGYNELLTGYADPFPVFNTPTPNRNRTVLDFLNNLADYKGRVVAFSSWFILPYVLNSPRTGLPINGGYSRIENPDCDSALRLSSVQDSIIDKGHTRYDLLTYLTACEYIHHKHPRVVYISLGETDEFAHQGRYDLYLQQASNVDKMIGELWYYAQTDPFYRNKTAFIITTDHGRGKRTNTWTTHNGLVGGSGQIWLALLGKGVEPEGEMKEAGKLGQNQVAATIAALLGEEFHPSSKVAPAIRLPIRNWNLASAGGRTR